MNFFQQMNIQYKEKDETNNIQQHKFEIDNKSL